VPLRNLHELRCKLEAHAFQIRRSFPECDIWHEFIFYWAARKLRRAEQCHLLHVCVALFFAHEVLHDDAEHVFVGQ